MYYVRDARKTMNDLTALVEIGEAVLRESPTYTHFTFDRRKAGNFIYDAMTKNNQLFLKVIARKDNDQIVGGIVCICEELVTSRDKIAYDITIMIDKEHRAKCVRQVKEIVDQYVDWAIRLGAKVIKMGVSSSINIDKTSEFFEHMGFKRIGAMHAFVLEA